MTGATGLIGRSVLPLLEKSGWTVHALVRRRPGEDSSAVRYHLCDLAGEFSLSNLPPAADAVIHLAQSEHFREFPDYSENIAGVNTLSTIRLLDYARAAGVKTFVLASSGGIYGHGIEEFREDEPIAAQGDLGFYLGTKLCSELLAQSYTPFMNLAVLRFFFVYGPGQRSHMLIPRLIDRVRQGLAITLQNSAGIKINPTFVTDAALAVVRALGLADSQIINVAGPDVLSMRAIGEMIGDVLGRPPRFEVEKDVPPRDLVADTRKMAALLCPPTVRFADGIARMTVAAD
jgi:nucleoside-diphosphate-sugar epimerase